MAKENPNILPPKLQYICLRIHSLSSFTYITKNDRWRLFIILPDIGLPESYLFIRKAYSKRADKQFYYRIDGKVIVLIHTHTHTHVAIRPNESLIRQKAKYTDVLWV